MADEATDRRGLISRLIRFVITLSLLLVGAAAAAWFMARPTTPDAFYGQPFPQDARSGALLASEPFTTGVPAGAQGWRILYVTARTGKATLASAVVVAPVRNSGESRPMIAWAHGTTGVVSGCAPSVMGKPFDNLPDIGALLREGWVFVGADYPGLGTDGGHTYLVGNDAAQAVLDAALAARQLVDAHVDDRIVVWGHSQGGNSALWTGIRATTYAPGLKLLGVAALAPASDLKGLVAASKGSMFGKIVSSYILQGYAQAYSDVIVDEYASGMSRVLAADIATRCIGGYGTLFSVFETKLLPADGIFSRDPGDGPLGTRLEENTPGEIIPAPVLIAQGEADDLVSPEVQMQYVRARCTAGQKIEFRTYAGRDHVSLVASDSPLGPELLSWTRARFEGKPAEDTCNKVTP